MVLGGFKVFIKKDDTTREQFSINIRGGSIAEKKHYYALFMGMMKVFQVDSEMNSLQDEVDIPVVITFTLTNMPARVCKQFKRQLETQCPSVFSEVVIDKSCY